MRVTFLLDDEQVPEDDPGFDLPYDAASPQMEHHVIHATRGLGHDVRVFPLGADAHGTVTRIAAGRPDVVWNLVEHRRGDRRVAVHVPSLLALYGLRCTGSSSAALALTCDKALATRLVGDLGLSVPEGFVVPLGTARAVGPMVFPMIVKPRYEDGSEGISLRSIVRTKEALLERARFIHQSLAQDALCQRYIDGRELSVGVLGNARPEALPAREMVFGLRHAGGPAIATELAKASKTYSEKWRITYERAALGSELARELAQFAVEVYRALEITGYGRVDFRLDEAGRPYFLEANCNPDLRPRVFGVIAGWAGLGYGALLQRILDLSMAGDGVSGT